MIVQELISRLGLQIDEGSWAKGDRFIGAAKAGILGLATALGLNSISNMIESVVELGGQLNDTAQKTGVAVEALQFYGFVAKLNSSSAEGITHAMTKLNRQLGESAKTGKGPAVDALKKLGINFGSTEFKANSLDEKMQLISDRLAKLPDGPEKVALAMDLFGRSGAELIPTLNDLGKNGDELREQFKELGGGLSGEQTSALDDFGDNLDKAKFSLGAVKNQIVAGMLPALKELLDGFMGWLRANKEVIASGVRMAVEALIVAFKALGVIVGSIIDIYHFFEEHSTLAKAVLIAIAAVILSSVVPALAAMTLGWIEALAPILVAVAVISGIVLVLMDLWESFTTGKGIAATVWNYIVYKVTHASDRLKNVANKVANSFRSAWENIKSAAEAAFEWIANLPVIKQLIDVYKWAKGYGARNAQIQSNIDQVNREGLDPNGGSLTQQYLRAYTNGESGKDARGNPAGPTTVIATNNVTVNGANQSPEDIAAQILQHQSDMVRKAVDDVKGGRR